MAKTKAVDTWPEGKLYRPSLTRPVLVLVQGGLVEGGWPQATTTGELAAVAGWQRDSQSGRYTPTLALVTCSSNP